VVIPTIKELYDMNRSAFQQLKAAGMENMLLPNGELSQTFLIGDFEATVATNTSSWGDENFQVSTHCNPARTHASLT
jgi:hypothetical protein